MTTFMFVLMAVAMFACIFGFVKGFFWITKKGSPASQLIVSAASVVFCLVMAYTNSDQSKAMSIVSCCASPFYLWMAVKAFNKLVPTKEK